MQPWQREDLHHRDLLRHRSGAPMNLEDKARALRQEASVQQHPRSLDDRRLGRTPQSLLEEEARTAQLAAFPPRVPPYQGQIVLRTTQRAHVADLGGRTPMHTTNLSWHPTQAACLAQLEHVTGPLIALAQAAGGEQ